MKRILSALVIVTGLLFMGFQNTALAQDHGEPPVKELEADFNELLQVKNEESSLISKGYDTIEKLEQVFGEIMVPALAEVYVGSLYKEEDGKVMVLPQDGRQTIDFNREYDFTKVNDNHYKLSQVATSDLYEGHTLTIDYIYKSGEWIFGNRNNLLPEVHVDGGEEEGDQLPDTATPFPAYMLIGAGIMMSGAIVLVARKRSNA
ncbi:LPXTG cell wall anchor domain-containing protein [Alkalihalobacillus sp. CinArs1]|uniref:LPXTG cell wall anchor domain-containing protein n=1 Tax=Alkalihalobacillus sp. CinArs1 TaxID=2995314 RepID=UPI0022DD21DC|nr:LPXTG cell wall anchor domain-containing protein [Alkalihalobacillus sp. CinArs1]